MKTVTTHECEGCGFKNTDEALVLACEAQGVNSLYKLNQEVILRCHFEENGPAQEVRAKIAGIFIEHRTHKFLNYLVQVGSAHDGAFAFQVEDGNILPLPTQETTLA